MQLYLCEKPSQARDIARVLGLSGRGEGCIEGDTVTVTGLWGICWSWPPQKRTGSSSGFPGVWSRFPFCLKTGR